LRGRDFNEHDDEHAPLVAVVNQTFARQIFGTEDPVGKTFRYGSGSPSVQVVGLVKDGKYVSLTEAPDPVIFRCMLQEYNTTTLFAVRSHNASASIVAAIRNQIRDLDPKLPVYGMGSLGTMLGFAMFPMHAAAIALSAFGVLALVLTMTGIYGLVDYSVARRTREIGIRIAVGARPVRLLRLLLGKLILLVSVGILFGGLLSFAAEPVLSAVIYTTSPRDPALLAGVLVLMLVVTLLAASRPVVRGLGVDPVSALRFE
jgi:ABC-type antimicrobial peptide transport system permease subunit